MSSLTETLLNIPGPGEGEPIIAIPTPQATAPSSQIDPTLPVYGNPTTQSVRQNFATAQVEITGLMQATQGAPFLSLAGGRMAGPMYLFNDPTDLMMPVTLGYFNANGGGGTGGGGGIPEAPSDGKFYTRSQGAWVPGVALSGGTICQMTGELLLAGNPPDALGAVPKQYADAIATTANAAVMRGGDIMTGLLTLSGDPAGPLGATTKQYTDAADALRAPIASPNFTGRVIITAASGPILTLYDTTASRPCFGVYNTGGYLSFGLAVPATGAPSGSPFATMDQTGNFLFATRINCTNGRIISSSATQAASITLNQTTQSHIYGLWAGATLAFGITDATGAPQTSVTSMDYTGNWTMNGTLHVAQGVIADGGYFGLNSGAALIRSSTSTGPGSLAYIYNPGFNWIPNGGGFGLAWQSISPVIIPSGTNCSDLIYTSGTGGPTGAALAGHDNGGNYYQNFCDVGSDARIKDKIADSEIDALAVLGQIPIRQFDVPQKFAAWFAAIGKEGDERDRVLKETPTAHVEIGMVAQEIAAAIPEAVSSAQGDAPEGSPIPADLQFWNAHSFIPYLVRSIQQLAARLDDLERTRH